jgi:AcrR family transcriptional regulator
MGRPPSIDDGELLRVARSAFMERGARATTAEIAQRAGVSEASLFKRWKTKPELYRAAMAIDDGALPLFIAQLPTRVGVGVVQEHLFEMGELAIEFYRVIVPMMMMSWSNREMASKHPHHRRDGGPLRGLAATTRYFAAEQELGRFRRDADPEVLARMFISSMYQYVFYEAMLDMEGQKSMDEKQYIAEFIEVFMSGAKPAARPDPEVSR